MYKHNYMTTSQINNYICQSKFTVIVIGSQDDKTPVEAIKYLTRETENRKEWNVEPSTENSQVLFVY